MATLVAPVAVVEIGSSWPTSDGGSTDPPVVDPLTVILTSPAEGDTVATALPQFVVAVETDDEDPAEAFTLTMQYSDTATFTSATTLTATFTAIDGGAIFTATDPAPGTSYWRAQLSQGSTLRSDWTPPVQFTVNAAVDPSELLVTWTVDPAAPRPIHLWHVDPAGPVIGELVTVYGQGFPAHGHLSLDGDTISVTSWALVPANTDTTIAGRIDGETVTPEHYEVVFAAPDREVNALLTVED